MSKHFSRAILLIGFLIGFSLTSAYAGITSVILQLKDDPAAVVAANAREQGQELSEDQIQVYRQQLQATQDSFLQKLTQRGVTFQVRSISLSDPSGNTTVLQFRYTLVYNGIALTLPEESIATVESMSEVRKVHADSVFVPNLDQSVKYIRAPELYGGVAELTQFDDLREGFEGQGIFISVIDTGIEWQHEMFGGDPSPPRLGIEPPIASLGSVRNQKIIYYLPLADAAVEDAFGHGTHVASTAAGYLGFAPGPDGLPTTEDDIPLHGVAPQARLMSYAVCSDVLSTVGSLSGAIGGCLSSAIIMGIEDSVSPRTINGFAKPVAHVINMSLGGSGTPDSPTAVASDNASRLGTIVVAAAGNSGPGQATVGAPAAGRHVIAVAAATDPGSGGSWSADVLDPSAVNRNTTGAVIPAANLAAASGQRTNIKLFPMAGTPAPPKGSLGQYYVYVEGAELATNFPPSTRGRIVLARAGGLPATFAQVANNAAVAGALAVLFISATENPTAVRATIPGATITPADGTYLTSLISGDPAVNPPSGALSNHPLRLNPTFGTSFEGEIAGFSSRGPVAGFGQIKPDVAAPGVNILAALPPASLLGVLAGGNYGAISGTSMASPHVAGAAALLKQAHPGWSPNMIRTALINTATNPRDANGVPKADGPTDDSIIDQGGGLIDVFEAAHARALMGVIGDGVEIPSILGSHSFGTKAIVNNRIVNTETVAVHLLDLSGEASSYRLRVANNRELEKEGINVKLSTSSLTVPPGGTSTYKVEASLNGSKVRDTSAPIQVQWYVVAESTDGQETLRMPFFLQATPSLPAASGGRTETYTGTVLVGDNNLELASGVTFVDVPFEVSESTLSLEADLEFLELVDDTVADLDFFLLDPDGETIASSTNPGGPESLTALTTKAGTYVYRVTGYLNAPTDFTITSTQVTGGGSPTLAAFQADFVNAEGTPVDFDGNFTVSWQGIGGEHGFEVERSADRETWEVVGATNGSQHQLALQKQANGTYYFRVRAIVDGQTGFFVTPASNVEAIVVGQRVQQKITRQVSTAISNVSFANGVFQLDLNMTNQSQETFVPRVELSVIKIKSSSGSVEVINADNGGKGTNKKNPALFGYSNLLGSDESFTGGETTGSRQLQFRDQAAELFSFDILVTGYKLLTTGGSPAPGAAGSGQPAPSSTETGILNDLDAAVLRYTVNPLTKLVTVELISLP